MRVHVNSVLLSDLLFFISSADCSYAVGSTRVCVRWDVNRKPLIAYLLLQELPLFTPPPLPAALFFCRNKLTLVFFENRLLLLPFVMLVWAHRVSIMSNGQCGLKLRTWRLYIKKQNWHVYSGNMASLNHLSFALCFDECSQIKPTVITEPKQLCMVEHDQFHIWVIRLGAMFLGYCFFYFQARWTKFHTKTNHFKAILQNQ